MDTLDRLDDWAAKVKKRRDLCKNEDTTRNSLVLPLIRDVLGYDTDDPNEVRLEYPAGFKDRHQKIDCAILDSNGDLLGGIECKNASVPSSAVDMDQLKFYFTALRNHHPSFSILIWTNGSEWRFYTDLNASNICDDLPWYTLNSDQVDINDADALDLFVKGVWDEQTIREFAVGLREEKAQEAARAAYEQRFSEVLAEVSVDDVVRDLALRVEGKLTGEDYTLMYHRVDVTPRVEQHLRRIFGDPVDATPVELASNGVSAHALENYGEPGTWQDQGFRTYACLECNCLFPSKVKRQEPYCFECTLRRRYPVVEAGTPPEKTRNQRSLKTLFHKTVPYGERGAWERKKGSFPDHITMSAPYAWGEDQLVLAGNEIDGPNQVRPSDVDWTTWEVRTKENTSLEAQLRAKERRDNYAAQRLT